MCFLGVYLLGYVLFDGDLHARVSNRISEGL
jgi:hypothetical protein